MESEKEMYLMEEENRPDVGGDSVMIEKMVEEYVVLNTSDICVDESAPIQSTSAFYITIYIVCLGITRVLSKFLMDSHLISPFEILSVKGTIGIILNLSYLWYSDISLFDVEASKARKVLLGAFTTFLALSAHFVALQFLPLGTAISLEYISYHFSLFFDSLFFVFAVRGSQLGGYAAAFLGAIALLYEKHDESNALPLGVIFGLIGSLLSGICSILSRQTIAKVNPVLGLVYTDFISAAFSPTLAFFEFGELATPTILYTRHTVVLLVLIGVVAWVGNVALSKTIQEEKVMVRPYVFRYVLVPVGLLVDICVRQVTVLEIFGMLLIGVQFGFTMWL